MTDSHSGGSRSHKLWGGRFTGGPAPELEAVNRSIDVDFRLWPFDIQLSKAWAAALAQAGVLTNAEATELQQGLDEVGRRIAGGITLEGSDEDVHTLIDRLLHDVVGGVASRLHTGRSRNDQVATATRLWTKDACARLDARLLALQQALIAQAESLELDVMPAYTHLQRAQPVSGAHWMLSHFWPIARDRRRLAAAADACAVLPLGSGAIAGSAFPVDRSALQVALGFRAVSQNSIDAVGDRDFIAEVLFTLAVLGAHLSRLAEDLILFGSSEFAFVRFGDAYSTGSSMMPQKRNPDALELARGSGARMLGDLVALLGTIKGLPSGYNKDLQEDKRSLFDAVDGMSLLLPAITGSLASLTFNRARMKTAVTSTMMATDLADYLVRKQVTFREAHGAVGKLVREAEEKGVEMTELPFSSFKAASGSFEADALDELSPSTSLAHRNLDGGTGPDAVRRQIAAAKTSLTATG
ncbi:MAG: argininosuccinate lyase [Gemmatimonas sp.]|nr:argininosuccinate lyase [Gemmatimonas sp.]